MEIDEIKCALCSQLYNEQDRMPILLPDCGHSFCYTCIQGCFELLKDDQKRREKAPECDCKKHSISPSPFEFGDEDCNEPPRIELKTNNSAPVKRELRPLNTSGETFDFVLAE